MENIKKDVFEEGKNAALQGLLAILMDFIAVSDHLSNIMRQEGWMLGPKICTEVIQKHQNGAYCDVRCASTMRNLLTSC